MLKDQVGRRDIMIGRGLDDDGKPFFFIEGYATEHHQPHEGYFDLIHAIAGTPPHFLTDDEMAEAEGMSLEDDEMLLGFLGEDGLQIIIPKHDTTSLVDLSQNELTDLCVEICNTVREAFDHYRQQVVIPASTFEQAA